jgi:hypothetical protein
VTCIAGAEDFIQSRGLTARAGAVGGSFFNAEDIPADAQLYMLGFILHDWNNEDCRRILRAVAARMDENSTVMLVEFVRPNPFPLPHLSPSYAHPNRASEVRGTCHLWICPGAVLDRTPTMTI